MTAAVGVGVAGLGRIGRVHAENLAARIPRARLVKVIDQAPDRAQLTGAELEVDWSTSFHELLDDPAVNAVVIATPTALHPQMTEQAAAAGKHVYCEKPLALDLEATVRAVDTARAADVQLQIGFHRRFDPDLALLHDHIRHGDLGDIALFKATFREMTPPPPGYLRACGGIFADTVIHDLDLARWLVGDITELTATTAHHDHDHAWAGDGLSAALLLTFANGALGLLDTTRRAGYGYEAAVEILGSRATVRAGHAQPRDHLEHLAGGHASRHLPTTFHQRFGDAYRLALTSFVDAIHADRPVTPSGQDAIAALTLATTAARSAVEKRTLHPAALTTSTAAP
jgi:myo-inositol 2-dehydrogenase/D-chiro-inositol 1-dehydrogenase